jgi:hypothetical protein
LNGVLVVLPWIVALVIVAVMAVVFRFWGEDGPRSDDPPDSGDESARAALAT